jgi:hypothetical protein
MKMMVQLQWDKGTESSPLIRQWLIDHSYWSHLRGHLWCLSSSLASEDSSCGTLNE